MPELKRPEEAPRERPVPSKKTKKEKEPRAVGLLQLNSKGKGALIPVAILIDGKFYDASAYKADPVPMALEGGTVYEVERAGESQGLFTVRGALHNTNPDSTSPWVGAGSYVLNGATVAKTTHRAEDKPIGLDNSDDAPPRLTRGRESQSTSTAPADASAGSTSGGATGAGSGSAGKPGTIPPGSPSGNGASGGGDSRKDGQKASSSASTSSPSDKAGEPSAKGQTQSTTPGQAAPRQSSQAPANQAPANQGPAGQGSASQASTAQVSAGQGEAAGQGAANYYRPALRRGKPTEEAPDDAEDETVTKADKATPAAGGGAPDPLQLVPAISDAGGPEPQSYKFFWKEGDEDERRKQMLGLAGDDVLNYVSNREKGIIPAKPAVKASGVKARTAVHKSAKQQEPVFENVQFRAFDVWKNDQPVMILSADARLPSTAPAVTTLPELYNVTIVARTDIYGNVRKLYSGVTDKFHLDVTPRLELIDVVDADGDGRGELLFRETNDAGSGYLIYRATADTLWKMFDSLGEE